MASIGTALVISWEAILGGLWQMVLSSKMFSWIDQIWIFSFSSRDNRRVWGVIEFAFNLWEKAIRVDRWQQKLASCLSPPLMYCKPPKWCSPSCVCCIDMSGVRPLSCLIKGLTYMQELCCSCMWIAGTARFWLQTNKNNKPSHVRPSTSSSLSVWCKPGGGGGQTCLSLAKNEVTRAFANHVRTFCYTSAQARPVLVIAQLTLLNTRQVLPPSVMMLVKGGTGWKCVLCSSRRRIDWCNKIWQASVLETKNASLLLHCNKGDKWQLGPNPMNGTLPQGVLYKTCTQVFARWWLREELQGCFCNW
jgi:hypothetical protein